MMNLDPAEYLRAAKYARSRGEEKAFRSFCESILKEHPNAPEASVARQLLGDEGFSHARDDSLFHAKDDSVSHAKDDSHSHAVAGGTLLISILCLPFGLFMTVIGHQVASDSEGQIGGGLAMFFGWGMAYLGNLVMVVSVLAAGISLCVIAVKSLFDSATKNKQR